MNMKITYRILGGHTHISIFTGKNYLGKAGDICMTNEEFEAWKNNTIKLEFVELK